MSTATDVLPPVVSAGGRSTSELLAALGEQGVQLNQAARDLLTDPRFPTGGEAVDVRITARSVADLGLPGGATYPEIVERARERGLGECPLELAPCLRLQFMGQREAAESAPSQERGAPSGALTVAAVPLDESVETPKGFYLRHADGVLWLRGYWSDAAHVWRPGDVFVFAAD